MRRAERNIVMGAPILALSRLPWIIRTNSACVCVCANFWWATRDSKGENCWTQLQNVTDVVLIGYFRWYPRGHYGLGKRRERENVYKYNCAIVRVLHVVCLLRGLRTPYNHRTLSSLIAAHCRRFSPNECVFAKVSASVLCICIHRTYSKMRFLNCLKHVFTRMHRHDGEITRAKSATNQRTSVGPKTFSMYFGLIHVHLNVEFRSVNIQW